MPTTELADEDFSEEGTIDLISMLVKAGMVPTRSEGRRAIEQGGVSIDGEKITDVKYTVAKDALTGEGVVTEKKAKRNSIKFWQNKKFIIEISADTAEPVPPISGGKDYEEIRSKRTSSDVPRLHGEQRTSGNEKLFPGTTGR